MNETSAPLADPSAGPSATEIPAIDILVAPEETGQRVDRLLAERLGDFSRSRLKALIEEGRLTVDGATIANPSLRVKPGQRLVLAPPPPVDDRPQPQAMDLAIVYEDTELLVLDKPVGLVVHPAAGNLDQTLVNALLAHCGDSLTGIGGVKRPGIVHRLDKDTSGLMVVAKTDRAHVALSAAFAERTIERAYWAVVWGVPNPREGEIDGPIGRSPVNRKKMAVVASGKPALTRYKVVRPLGLAAALVECRLATGRTHQIRVHMTEIGHPLIGDQVYGRVRPAHLKQLDPAAAAMAGQFPRQALHAWLLGFEHPTTGEHLSFKSPLPADLADLVAILE
ncbi:RluA family pseudouridine synthase [Aliidongia dinghuensis]|nr:RluA family pseudouridine synthase [Aliidongia dinghuensis]